MTLKLPLDIDKDGLIDPGPSPRGSSTSSKLLLCPRKKARAEQLNIQWGSTATKLGSLTHLGLAHAVCERHAIPGPLPWREALTVWQEREKHPVGTIVERWIHDTVKLALAEMDVQFPNWEPVAVERVILSHIQPDAAWDWADLVREHDPSGVLHTQRIDLGIECLGKVHFLDWKTTYSIRQRTFDEHILNLQMVSAAFLGFQLFGNSFADVQVARLDKRHPAVKIQRVPTGPIAIQSFELGVVWARFVELTFANRPWAEHPPAFHPDACLGRYSSKCDNFAACNYGDVEL